MCKAVIFFFLHKPSLTTRDTKFPSCKLKNACAAPTYTMLLSKVLLAYHRIESLVIHCGSLRLPATELFSL